MLRCSVIQLPSSSQDGTVDYAILCTRNLTNKNGEKLDCGIAFLHVGETRGDTFMRQVHLFDFFE